MSTQIRTLFQPSETVWTKLHQSNEVEYVDGKGTSAKTA